MLCMPTSEPPTHENPRTSKGRPTQSGWAEGASSPTRYDLFSASIQPVATASPTTHGPPLFALSRRAVYASMLPEYTCRREGS